MSTQTENSTDSGDGGKIKPLRTYTAERKRLAYGVSTYRKNLDWVKRTAIKHETAHSTPESTV